MQGTFDLDSAYLTAAWRDGLQLEVIAWGVNFLPVDVASPLGFQAGPLYDNVYTLSMTHSTLINFDFKGITQVEFITSGGRRALARRQGRAPNS